MAAAQRILIRPFAAEDAPAFQQAVLASADTVGRVFSWCHGDYSLEDANAWVARCVTCWYDRSEFPFAIVDPVSDELLGSISINHLHPVHRSGNVGYWVRAGQTRRGIATAAVTEVARFAFGELGLVRLEIVTQTDNFASRGVAEKSGARFECLARNRVVVNGHAQDGLLFSLIPEDLAANA